jgi:hypothetical protein
MNISFGPAKKNLRKFFKNSTAAKTDKTGRVPPGISQFQKDVLYNPRYFPEYTVDIPQFTCREKI